VNRLVAIVIACGLVGVLSGCTVPLGFGVRLNADDTVDFILCDRYPVVERATTVDDWEVTTVDYRTVSRSDLTVGVWRWETERLPFVPDRPCDGLTEADLAQ